MSISAYIKKAGRGAKGASHLTRDEARDAFAHILDGTVSDMELGAFCLAMRIKGETGDELAGFLDALEAKHLAKLELPLKRPAVILPSYNGARRTPNWVPLLALLLADQGIPVIVHGNVTDEKRTTTLSIFEALGLPVAHKVADIAPALQQGQPVFVPLAVLSPALQRLLDVREQIGLRNFGHVVAKLVNPLSSPALPIFNYTHPVYPQAMQDLLHLRPADLVVMRGHEGEPVASPQRLPMMVHYAAGAADAPARTEEIPYSAADPASASTSAIDAASTAAAIRRIRAGDAPVPESIRAQAEQILRFIAQMEQKEATS